MIDLGDSVVISGGNPGKTKVIEMKEDGSVTNLQDMINKRYSHGCGSYIDSDNNIVRHKH